MKARSAVACSRVLPPIITEGIVIRAVRFLIVVVSREGVVVLFAVISESRIHSF
jgi:hypothetical protein